MAGKWQGRMTKKRMAKITVGAYGWKKSLNSGWIKMGGKGTTAQAIITKKGEKKFK